MSRIADIIENPRFHQRLEAEVSQLVVGTSVRVADEHDGLTDGKLSCLSSVTFVFSVPQGEDDLWTFAFKGVAFAAISYLNSEGEHRSGETEGRFEGLAEIQLGDAFRRINFDPIEAVMESYLRADLDTIDFRDAQVSNEDSFELMLEAESYESPKKTPVHVHAETLELKLIPEGELQIQQFGGSEVRKVLHNDEWFFSVIDVILALTESSRPAAYWADHKKKLVDDEGFSELYGKIEKLYLRGKDGVSRPSEMANTETVFRIIQSIPSPKAEPFKRWLAKVGYERIQERQNPSIAIKRAVVDYQMQGRSMEWIDARLRTILSRRELTDEWQKRGIEASFEYGKLTDVISKETFGKTTKEHGAYKSLLPSHNLRDNMTEMELILTMLGETSTRQIAQAKDAVGFEANKEAASAGGKIAGNALKELEKQLGTSVVSKENQLKKLNPSKDLLNFPAKVHDTIKAIAKVPTQKKKPKKK